MSPCRCLAAIVSTLPPGGPAPPNDVLPLLLSKLESEGTRLAAAHAVAALAGASAPPPFAPHLPALLPQLQALLRKAARGLRAAALQAAAAVAVAAGADVNNPKLADGLLSEAVGMATNDDLLLAAGALNLAVAVLQVCTVVARLNGQQLQCDADRTSRSFVIAECKAK